MLIIGTNQVTPFNGDNVLAGEPDAGIWAGKTDDLWSYGKPAGWGGPWWKSSVVAGVPSDPFLMTGFEHKCLHLQQESSRAFRFIVEIDFLGDGSWVEYNNFEVAPDGYVCHVFPEGFSAHWVRITPGGSCTVSAYLTYT